MFGLALCGSGQGGSVVVTTPSALRGFPLRCSFPSHTACPVKVGWGLCSTQSLRGPGQWKHRILSWHMRHFALSIAASGGEKTREEHVDSAQPQHVTHSH